MYYVQERTFWQGKKSKEGGPFSWLVGPTRQTNLLFLDEQRKLRNASKGGEKSEISPSVGVGKAERTDDGLWLMFDVARMGPTRGGGDYFF